MQRSIPALGLRRQIVLELTCPRLTLFLRGLFLDSWYVILREHEEDLLWLTEAFVCLPQCTSGGRLLSASWLFRPFVPKVCSGSWLASSGNESFAPSCRTNSSVCWQFQSSISLPSAI